MTRRQGPTKRLLIAPAAILVLVIVGVHLVRDATARPADERLALPAAELAVTEQPPGACTRGTREVHPAATRVPPPRAGRVTSAMVVACPAAFDEARVRYVGELVGDLLHRDGGAWVMVNDDAYALEVGPLPAHRDHRGTNSGLAVWLPDELLDRVTGLGRHGQRGDVVELEGHVLRTDPSDGGGLTLRADRLRVLAPATAIDEPVDLPQLLLAIGATAAAAALWFVRRRDDRPGAPAVRRHRGDGA